MAKVKIVDATPDPDRPVIRLKGVILDGPLKGQSCEGELTIQEAVDLAFGGQLTLDEAAHILMSEPRLH
jgi:hypothetical protein